MVEPVCTGNFRPCKCTPVAATCGQAQSCDLNGCHGTYDANSNTARCRGNFRGCVCTPGPNACGPAQPCDLNGCAGTYDFNSNVARCRGNFAGCICLPSSATCGPPQSCTAGGREGTYDNRDLAVATCKAAYRGCRCTPAPGQLGGCGTLGRCDFGDCNAAPVSGGTCPNAGCIDPVGPTVPGIDYTDCRMGHCARLRMPGAAWECLCMCPDGYAYGGLMGGNPGHRCNAARLGAPNGGFIPSDGSAFWDSLCEFFFWLPICW